MPGPTPEKSILLREIADSYAKENNLAVVGLLGEGGSSIVYSCVREGASVALKVYDPDFFLGDRGKAELGRINLQSRLIQSSCANLIKISHIGHHAETCVVEMENPGWSNLKDKLHEFPRKNSLLIIQQLVHAVRYLESLGLVHRDLKPENILISGQFDTIKLIDFGVLRDFSNDEDRPDGTDHGIQRPFLATAQYSSPEYLFRTLEPSEMLWKALNYYQVGGVLHDLLTGTPLFSKEVQTGNRYIVAFAVLKLTPSIQTDPENRRLAEIAQNCLVKDPELRCQLSNWDHFQVKLESPIEQLAAKFAEIRIRHNHARTAESFQKQLVQKRRQQLDTLFELTRRELVSSLGTDIKISQPNRTSDDTQLLVVAAPPTLGETQFVLHLEWGQETNEASVQLGLHGPKPASQEAMAIVGSISINSSSNDARIALTIAEWISERLIKAME